MSATNVVPTVLEQNHPTQNRLLQNRQLRNRFESTLDFSAGETVYFEHIHSVEFRRGRIENINGNHYNVRLIDELGEQSLFRCTKSQLRKNDE